MTKSYWHWDDAERYPRDDFDAEFEAEELLTADIDINPINLPPLIHTRDLNESERKLKAWADEFTSYLRDKKHGVIWTEEEVSAMEQRYKTEATNGN
jgi:hypothetical protein